MRACRAEPTKHDNDRRQAGGTAGRSVHAGPTTATETSARSADDDRGQAGGIEVLPFGLLVFVVGVLIAANVWAVVDAKLATDAAAREATRQFVEARVVEAGEADAAASAAAAVGLEALAAHGRDPSRASVDLSSLDDVAGRGGFVRCARATFTASYRLPALALPLVRSVGSGIEVRSRHSGLVDPFRDGVPGDVPSSDAGACA